MAAAEAPKPAAAAGAGTSPDAPAMGSLFLMMNRLNGLFAVMAELPTTLYDRSIAAADAIEGKLYQFGDSLIGKTSGDVGEKTSTAFVAIPRVHHAYLTQLKQSNPQRHAFLMDLAKRASALPRKEQPAFVANHFRASGGT